MYRRKVPKRHRHVEERMPSGVSTSDYISAHNLLIMRVLLCRGRDDGAKDGYYVETLCEALV